MTDIQRYHRGLDHCAKMAGESATDEIRELWLTVKSSYQFLLERAERAAREERIALGRL
jgi:hypothetical protein